MCSQRTLHCSRGLTWHSYWGEWVGIATCSRYVAFWSVEVVVFLAEGIANTLGDMSFRL